MHRRSFGCPPRWMRSPTSALLGAAWREDLACDDNGEFAGVSDRTTLARSDTILPMTRRQSVQTAEYKGDRSALGRRRRVR